MKVKTFRYLKLSMIEEGMLGCEASSEPPRKEVFPTSQAMFGRLQIFLTGSHCH